MSSRGIAPVVAVVLVVVCTIGLSVGVVAISGSIGSPSAPPQAILSGTADASTGVITISHDGGEALDVDSLALVVAIDGEELVHQPPVPFFSSNGFAPGPTGAFNVASDRTLTAGETASFELASSNEPQLESESVVRIRVIYEEAVLLTIEFTAS